MSEFKKTSRKAVSILLINSLKTGFISVLSCMRCFVVFSGESHPDRSLLANMLETNCLCIELTQRAWVFVYFTAEFNALFLHPPTSEAVS